MPLHTGLVSDPDITRLINNVNWLTAQMEAGLVELHGPTANALATCAEVRVDHDAARAPGCVPC